MTKKEQRKGREVSKLDNADAKIAKKAIKKEIKSNKKMLKKHFENLLTSSVV